MRFGRRNETTKYIFQESGDGYPIVFLHGLFGELSNWSETISHFSKNYRVIVPELPVFDPVYHITGLNGLVKYLDKLVTEIGLKEFVLGGNSLGGHIAILYTLAYPQKVSGLILTGSSGLYESTMGASYPKRGDYAYIEEKVGYTFYNNNVVTKSLVDNVYNTVNDIGKSLSVIRMARFANRNNVEDSLQYLNKDTLLIWGKEDRITPPETGQKFRSLIKNSELHIIPDCGHVPMMEHPQLFNSIMEDFLVNLENKRSENLVRSGISR
jgi:2-hydroxy-6-oxonona-2,4-dienedioate hydrolase